MQHLIDALNRISHLQEDRKQYLIKNIFGGNISDYYDWWESPGSADQFFDEIDAQKYINIEEASTLFHRICTNYHRKQDSQLSDIFLCRSIWEEIVGNYDVL